MKKLIGAIFAAELLVCALSVSSYAGTLNFDERTVPGGDFDNIELLSNDFIGTAPTDFLSVSGSLSGRCNEELNFVRCSSPLGVPSPDDAEDALIFSIADRFKIKKVKVISTGTGPDGFQVSFALTSYNAGYNFPTSSTLIFPEINTASQFSLEARTSYNPYAFDGFNMFGIDVSGFTADVGGDFALNWNVELEFAAASATSVPLPASAPLLFAALGGFAFLRRKKRARGTQA